VAGIRRDLLRVGRLEVRFPVVHGLFSSSETAQNGLGANADSPSVERVADIRPPTNTGFRTEHRYTG